MSTSFQQASPAVPPAAHSLAPSLIRQTRLLARENQGGWLGLLPAWIASAVLHCVLLFGFWFVLASNDMPAAAGLVKEESIQTSINRPLASPEDEGDITNTDIGFKPKILSNTTSLRQADVTVHGPTDPLAILGNRGMNTLAADVAPLPPGYDRKMDKDTVPGPRGTGPGVRTDMAGSDFLRTPGGFEGRSGGTRQLLVETGGGNAESEAAVARALEWLSLHQGKDGSWSLDSFDEHGHDASGKEYHCTCGDTGIHNHIAATAFALLPYLGAGLTPEAKGDKLHNYSKTLDAGLHYLQRMQKEDGALVVRAEDRRSQSFMYAHCLATIVLCEAASLSPSPALKDAAQRALDFLNRAQHPAGGWRYRVKQEGDLSVSGWAIMALQSGRLAGLDVKRDVLEKASSFLDSIQIEDGGAYGYQHRPAGENSVARDPSMTAAGLLCRQYLGWGPNNAGLLKGIARLRKMQPELDKPMNIYYYYYATQVMHHMGGASWREWNLKMRDLLIAKQDKGLRNPHQRGSWSPTGDPWGVPGGRIMMTSLACLTLEVYYRHLPLYQELGGKR